MIQLEKYHGTRSRHTCPACHSRHCFVRYIDENGNYLSDSVGRCNRESKCGYHKKPKEHFAENPTAKIVTNSYPKKQKNHNSAIRNNQKSLGKIYTPIYTSSKKDVIKKECLSRTLANYEQNSLVQFLSSLFCDESAAVQNVIQRYLIGTWKDGLTVFWQIDGRGGIRTGKLMRFDVQTGKRQIVRTWMEDGERHELKAYWMHKELIKQRQLTDDFKLKQCFFGEHLLRTEPGKKVAIVEAEKTAVIASICFPEMIWLAAGAKGYLTGEKCKVLSGRKVLLFPDADAYTAWQEKAVRAQRNGLNVRVSSLIETHGTDAEKENGFDIADYLIKEQIQKNIKNNAYDKLVKSPFFNGWTSTGLF